MTTLFLIASIKQQPQTNIQRERKRINVIWTLRIRHTPSTKANFIQREYIIETDRDVNEQRATHAWPETSPLTLAIQHAAHRSDSHLGS